MHAARATAARAAAFREFRGPCPKSGPPSADACLSQVPRNGTGKGSTRARIRSAQARRDFADRRHNRRRHGRVPQGRLPAATSLSHLRPHASAQLGRKRRVRRARPHDALLRAPARRARVRTGQARRVRPRKRSRPPRRLTHTAKNQTAADHGGRRRSAFCPGSHGRAVRRAIRYALTSAAASSSDRAGAGAPPCRRRSPPCARVPWGRRARWHPSRPRRTPPSCRSRAAGSPRA